MSATCNPIDVVVATNDDIYGFGADNRKISKVVAVNGRNTVSPVFANLQDLHLLAMPSAFPGARPSDAGSAVSLKVRNKRLVMTMEQVVVQISPLPN